MDKLLLIGFGGFLGAVLRYGVSGMVQSVSHSISFPYGTLTVNIIGCFFIGMLSQLAESYGLFSPEVRLFTFVGLLGAFTTFATFGNETFNLINGGEGVASLLNIGLHIILGLSAVWFGQTVALLIGR